MNDVRPGPADLQMRLWLVSGQPATGLTDLRQTVADFRQFAPPGHRSHGTVLGTLGTALVRAGQPDEAATVLRAALDAERRSANGQMTEPIAGMLSLLGMAELTRRRFAEAAELFREAVAHADASGNADSRAVTVWLNNLGVALRELGHCTEAEPLLRRAVATGGAIFGPDHFHPANAMKNLAQTCEQLGMVDEAIKHYREALSRFAAAPASSHPVAEKAEETRALLRALESRGEGTQQ